MSIELNGIKWKNYQGALIPDTPPHINIELSDSEKEFLLKESSAYFLRYTNEWDSEKKYNFWYIIKDKKENIEDYKSKYRNEIRRALKKCFVEKISKDFLAKNGYEVYIEATKKYKNFSTDITNEEFYNHIIKSNYDYFGVFEKDSNKLIGYSLNIIQDNMVSYGTIKFHPKFLKYGVSNIIFFEMNKYYINEKKYLYVCDGARSLVHQTNIQDYLMKTFHFRKAYCRMNIVYRKDIKLLVDFLYPFRNLISKIDNRYANKISGLLKQEEIIRLDKGL